MGTVKHNMLLNIKNDLSNRCAVCKAIQKSETLAATHFKYVGLLVRLYAVNRLTLLMQLGILRTLHVANNVA